MLFKTKFTLISKSFSGSNKYIRYIHLKKKINKIFFPAPTQKSSKEVLSSVLNNYDLTKQHLSYNNIGLLFLTQGLNTDDIKHINLLFNKFQITFTKLPIRVLSKSFFSSRLNLKSFQINGKKNYIYGEMLLIHSNNSIYCNECLDFIYKQIMYFFLIKTSNMRPFQGLEKPFDFYLKFPPLELLSNTHLILPWDLLGTKSLTSKKENYFEWFKGDVITSLIKLISKGSLSFLACLKKDAFTLGNIQLINENINLYKEYNTLSYIELEQQLVLNTKQSMEPYIWSMNNLNLSFFYYF